MNKNAKKWLVSLVPSASFVSEEALRQLNLRTRHNSLRQRLKRSEFEDAIIFGSTEVTFKGDRKKVSVHEHLIVANCQKEALESMRRFYNDNSQGVREMRVDPIKRKTLNKVTSYCLKNRTYGTDDLGYGKVRPPAHVEHELLLFLDRHTFRQLMFLKGVKFKGDKLVKT